MPPCEKRISLTSAGKLFGAISAYRRRHSRHRDGIWLYLLEREGLKTADWIVTEIFKSLFRLAEVPRIGHRRPDLTGRPVLFYRIFSYLVIYQPGTAPVQILGVLHGKRNVARILSQRL